MTMNKERWFKLYFVQQFGNIGSEITRARIAKESNDPMGEKKSLVRALDLIDCTVADTRWRGRLKELLRLREVLCDWLLGTRCYSIEPRLLEEYCISFALIRNPPFSNV